MWKNPIKDSIFPEHLTVFPSRGCTAVVPPSVRCVPRVLNPSVMNKVLSGRSRGRQYGRSDDSNFSQLQIHQIRLAVEDFHIKYRLELSSDGARSSDSARSILAPSLEIWSTVFSVINEKSGARLLQTWRKGYLRALDLEWRVGIFKTLAVCPPFYIVMMSSHVGKEI